MFKSEYKIMRAKVKMRTGLLVKPEDVEEIMPDEKDIPWPLREIRDIMPYGYVRENLCDSIRAIVRDLYKYRALSIDECKRAAALETIYEKIVDILPGELWIEHDQLPANVERLVLVNTQLADECTKLRAENTAIKKQIASATKKKASK